MTVLLLTRRPPPSCVLPDVPRRLTHPQILTVAALNNIEINLVPDFGFPEQMNPEGEFRKKFPLGKVPALECPDGFKLAETLAIITYVASSGPMADQLFGGSPSDLRSRAVVTSWVSFAETELCTHLSPIAGMVRWKYLPPDQTQYDICLQQLERCLVFLEGGLKERKQTGGSGRFLVGEKFTLADIMVYGMLWYGWSFVIDEAMRGKFPAIVEYFEGMWSIKEVSETFKEVDAVKERITLESAGVLVGKK